MAGYVIALVCVVGLAIGQLLFKMSSVAMASTGSLFSAKALLPLFFAMCLYGLTSIAWIWALQKVELGRIYPLMALAFVFVPLGSHLVFGERFQSQYFIGVGIIVVGIIVTVKS